MVDITILKTRGNTLEIGVVPALPATFGLFRARTTTMMTTPSWERPITSTRAAPEELEAQLCLLQHRQGLNWEKTLDPDQNG